MPKIPEGYADYAAGAALRGVKAASRATHGKHIAARKKADQIIKDAKAGLVRKKDKHG